MNFLKYVFREMGDIELDAESLRQLYDAAEDDGIKPMPKWIEAADLLLDDDDETGPTKAPAEDTEDPEEEVDTEDDAGEEDDAEEEDDGVEIELPKDYSGTITVAAGDDGEKGSED